MIALFDGGSQIDFYQTLFSKVRLDINKNKEPIDNILERIGVRTSTKSIESRERASSS